MVVTLQLLPLFCRRVQHLIRPLLLFGGSDCLRFLEALFEVVESLERVLLPATVAVVMQCMKPVLAEQLL